MRALPLPWEHGPGSGEWLTAQAPTSLHSLLPLLFGVPKLCSRTSLCTLKSALRSTRACGGVEVCLNLISQKGEGIEGVWGAEMSQALETQTQRR